MSREVQLASTEYSRLGQRQTPFAVDPSGIGQIHHRAGHHQEGSQTHPQLFEADAELLINNDELLQHEVFGPVVVVVAVNDRHQLQQALIFGGIHQGDS